MLIFASYKALKSQSTADFFETGFLSQINGPFLEAYTAEVLNLFACPLVYPAKNVTSL